MGTKGKRGERKQTIKAEERKQMAMTGQLQVTESRDQYVYSYLYVHKNGRNTIAEVIRKNDEQIFQTSLRNRRSNSSQLATELNNNGRGTDLRHSTVRR